MNDRLKTLSRLLKPGAALTSAAGLLLCQAALGQTIPNPSFESNSFTTPPGYVSDNSPITGWTAAPPESIGLNPAGGTNVFADNGAVPNGTNVAFIESSDSLSSILSTTISGLTAGTTYKVTFRENASNGQTPNLRISIDSTELLALTTYSAGSTNPYFYIAFEFTATAASQMLSILNDASVTNTLLVDDFRIAPSSGAWTVDAWNDDSTSGVDPTFFYTHAYAFNNSANPTINGVTFTGVPGVSPAVSGRFSTTYFANGTSRANNITGDSATLGSPFVYGGTVPAGAFQIINIQGLTPGTEYVATVFSYAWDGPGLTIRWVTFSANGDYLTVNQDQFGNNNGIRVSYRYTADTNGTATIKIAPINPANVSFHVCGFCNREAVSHDVAPVINTQPLGTVVAPGLPVTFSVAVQGIPAPTYQWRFNGANIGGAQANSYTVAQSSAQTAGKYDVVVKNVAGSVTSAVASLTLGMPLANPSFEADTFLNWPGYCGDNPGGNGTLAGPNTPITGWTLDDLNGGGLNPVSDSTAPNPFADNGITPNGTNVAFIQSSNTLRQTVSGFTVGSQYSVHYYENARTGGMPWLQVTMGGATVLAAHPIKPVGTGPYYDVYSDVFVATNTALELAFAKTDPTGGDSTALIDNVTVLPIPPGTPPRLLSQPISVTDSLVGDTVTFAARAIGTIPLSYQWAQNGVPLPGQTNATLTLANVVQTNSGSYVLTVSNASGSTNSLAAQLAVTARALAGAAYGTGVANDGTLLAAGSADPHYMLTVSPDPNAPAGANAIVVNFAWPIAAGVWVLDGPNSEWIAPSAGQGTGNAEGDYVYETTVDLTGQDLNQVQLVGAWAADNSGNDIKVNGASTGLTCPSFSTLTPFTLVKANGLVAGTNTLDFLVNNLPATPNPTGLRVDLKALVLLQPVSTGATLKVSRSGANIVISWTPTSQGQKLLSAHDLKGPWTEITGASNPYTAAIGATNTYFRVSQ